MQPMQILGGLRMAQRQPGQRLVRFGPLTLELRLIGRGYLGQLPIELLSQRA